MFKNVTGFSIQGGFYEKNTYMNNILSKRMNIVFGRNGSGKSSIANGFADQQDPNGPRKYCMSFLGGPNLPEVNSKNIFVFNEDFIDQKMKIEGELKSIVMLGKNVKLDEKIKNARNEKSTLISRKNVEDNLVVEYGQKAEESLGKIKKTLKDGYIKRLSAIEGKNKKLIDSITFDIIETASVRKVGNPGNYIGKLDTMIEELHAYEAGTPLNLVPEVTFVDIKAINKLLSKTVKPAELTPEEENILSILSSNLGDRNYLENTSRDIIDKELNFCPLCHQSVNHDHRLMLSQRLLRFKDSVIDDFKTEIKSAMDNIIQVVLPIPNFETVDFNDDLTDLVKSIGDMNDSYAAAAKALYQKYGNPYIEALQIDEKDFIERSIKLNAAISKINSDIIAYNKKIEGRLALREEIDEANKQLAYWESKSDIDSYNDNIGKKASAEINSAQLQTQINDKEADIRALLDQTEHIGKALDNINANLRVIFGKDRLRLESYGKDKYQVISRNKSIPPKALSIGERNAIALAYFFASIVEGLEEDYNYTDPIMLVVDDPISSFDLENKAGMMSLLGVHFAQILLGCPGSKVLVLTHDFMTLRDLCGIRKNLTSSLFVDDDDRKLESLDYIQLVNGRAESKNTGLILDNSDYFVCINSVYNYSNAVNPESNPNDATVGNSMRRMLELYARFTFRTSWPELFIKNKYLAKVPAEKQSAIKSLYFRSLLNTESHGTEEVYQSKEIQRVARMVLAYIYMTNPEHLCSYLREDQIENVKEWIEDL